MAASATQHEADSVLHSWCVPAAWDAPTVVGGEGAWLLLEDGRRILDLSSLSECSLLGHQHPRLVQAIRDQAQQLCFVTNPWGARVRAELAQELLEVSGLRGGRVFFTLGGADANENAIKIARLAQEQPQGAVIARDRSYHGASYMGMALSGDARVQALVDAGALNVHHVPPPYAYRCPFGTSSPEACGEAAAQAVAAGIDAIGSRQTAAVIMEPNAGSNGIVPPGSFWPALRRLTRDRGVLLIADEVINGYGRTGTMFATEQFGFVPDIMTMAKGISSGYAPISAAVVRDSVYEIFKEQPDKAFGHLLTFGGHPVSAAAALKNIEILREERLPERAKEMGTYLMSRLEELRAHPTVGDVRGLGLLTGIDLVSSKETKAKFAKDSKFTKRLGDLVIHNGFVTRVWDVMHFAPPLVVEKEEIDRMVEIADQALTVAEREFADEIQA